MVKTPLLTVRPVAMDRRLKADVLLVPALAVDGKAKLPPLPTWPEPTAARVADLLHRHHLNKKAGAVDAVVLPASAPFGRVALVSLGEKKPAAADDVRNAAAAAMEWCGRYHAASVAVVADTLSNVAEDGPAAWVEGAILGGFRYLSMRSKPSENGGTTVSTLLLATTSQPSRPLVEAIRRAEKIARAVNLARFIGHEPPNVINPVTLARRAAALARQHHLHCRILDDRKLRAMKMGAILAVGGGSVTKPRIIVLEYAGRNPRSRPVVLVGKAVTLDSGGYSLKPADSIPDMKYDKCGGVAVLATLVAAAELRLPQRVVGVIGAVENMISDTAYRPGDIVTAGNGVTIEVDNTDAEGRLVLADCLHFAEKAYRPTAMIDLATLTGACTIALGNACAAILSTSDSLASALVEAGERTGERLWRLPLWPVYREQINGTDGDIKNSGGRQAGTITAAMFLKEFVSEKTLWAHLDIAGVANLTKPQPTCPIGATGFGVRLLVDYLTRLGAGNRR